MAKLHDMRLKLLIQQEHERISKSKPNDLDLSIVQARCLCWLTLLAEAHEDQANDAEKRGDAEQAMGWFADSMRLRDVINLVTTIEIPYASETDTYCIHEEVANSSENNEIEIDKEIIHNSNINLTNINLPNASIDASEKNKESEFDFNSLSNVAQSLEKHYEKITHLIKINEKKLVELAVVEKKLLEKTNRIKNNNINNKFETKEESLLWAREKFNMLKNKAS